MRAQLIPADGTNPLEIRRDLTLVGRKEDSDLCLPHKSISKMHCVIVKTDGLLLIRDLGSTNGTRVNGLRIRRAALLPNDQLSIAGFKFRVHFGPAPAPAEVADNGMTQRLEPEDLAKLGNKQDGRAKAPGSGPAPNAFEPNHLPDMYSDRKDSRM
ncbi:MAG TPA: FHA domain-containing protein [Gemmataceae bacterium]|jgi:pSer/pThr/pTyr-binding forkhead associated (FHA) protein|nr:FHA domain-containing protein [Gemmataceae bacterium]